MKEITIAQRSDMNSLSQLAEALSSIDSKYLIDFSHPEAMNYLLELSKSGGRFFMATDKNKLVGSAICEKYGDKFKLHSVFVSKDYLRKGLGKGLLSMVKDSAKKEGCKEITTSMIKRKNDESRALFSSAGFHLEEKGEGYKALLSLGDK
ncbi:MAG: GNAT family N-acetyltransferase [Nanoarchaeota archaeon]|nr:GNAT family N-acetyltransferase [Nanoarchaeota archaeon]